MVNRRYRSGQTSLYSSEQVERVIQISGGTIQGEVDTDWIVYCPFHPNYNTPAAEVDKEKGTFFCFACRQVASLEEYYMKMTKSTLFQALRVIKSNATEVDFLAHLDKQLEVKQEYVSFGDEVIDRLHDQCLNSPRAQQYLKGRGIVDHDTYKLGYSEAQDMVTIPQYDPSGTICVGFVGRSVEGKEFKNTPKLPKSKILFNLHRVKQSSTAYVVESSFDAIRLHQQGISAVATLGANVSIKQCDLLLKYFNQVVVIGDNDEAGKMMSSKVLTKVGSRGIIVTLPDRFKDIGELTTEDIEKLHIRVKDPITLLGG